MVTKGYGFTVDDIDWSCPADLEPYAKARKVEVMENDRIIHAVCGNYVLSAVSVAVEHCLAGKKAKSEYIKKPILQGAGQENNGYIESNEDIAVYEMKVRANALKKIGLPESPM